MSITHWTFIHCDVCSLSQFELPKMSKTDAKKYIKEAGWKVKTNGETICPDCLKKIIKDKTKEEG